jgi:hypothetical protein
MDVAKVWDVIGIVEKKLDQHWMDVFGNYICDLGKHLWRRTLDPWWIDHLGTKWKQS